MTLSIDIFPLLMAPGGGTYGTQLFFIQIALFFAIFYFLLIRPQQKQRKLQEQRLLAAKKGDEIVTAGGIVGEIVHVRMTTKDGKTEPSLDDRITIKSGESRLVIERGRIARVGSAEGAATPAETK